jgi:hypothetical protein
MGISGFVRLRSCFFFTFFFASFLIPVASNARIEIILMGQARGLRSKPLGNENWFSGTPFGHMALYVESACPDDEKGVRQCREGERGGVVLTVDKELNDSYFIAIPRDEFFYGPLDPRRPPDSVDREDIEKALVHFNDEYGSLYNSGPGISGFGQDYGILYIRKAWGLVYPATREEEARIIEYWQEHVGDEFYPFANNCVSMVTESLAGGGLGFRSFLRRKASYNAFIYSIKKLLLARAGARAPDGNYLRRDGSYLTEYGQIPSSAVIPSNRPFNVYTLRNLEYLMWLCPHGEESLPSAKAADYERYPSGKEKSSGKPRRGFLSSRPRWLLSKPEEFIRLWIQSVKGVWYLINPIEGI